MLLDVYGHFMPKESGGYADALSASPDGTSGTDLPERAARAITPALKSVHRRAPPWWRSPGLIDGISERTNHRWEVR